MRGDFGGQTRVEMSVDKLCLISIYNGKLLGA